MALALDASTPALATSPDRTVTTASFTAPSGALLVACVGNYAASAPASQTVTDTGGLTWTLVDGWTQAGARVYTAFTGSSTARTVTYTQSSTGYDVSALQVLVITGADTTAPVDVTGKSSSNGAVISSAITTTRDGSWMWLANFDLGGRDVPTPVAGSSTQSGSRFADNASTYWTMWVAKRDSVTKPPGSVTIASSAPTASTQNRWVSFAVKSAGAQITASPVSTASAIPAPAARTGSLVSPVAVAGVAATPSATVRHGAKATPDAVGCVASVGGPVIQHGAGVAPAAVAVTASVPAATAGGGSRLDVDTIVATATISAPFVVSGLGFGGTSGVVRSHPRLVRASGSRRFSFRYELLDAANGHVADLDTVISCTVEQNWLADIKRKAKLRMRSDGAGIIDWMSDRIKPWVRLRLPPYGENDWVEWPQGVFLLSTPTRAADETGVVFRDVEGYDLAQLYADDLVTDRYSVAAGVAYTEAVSTLLDTAWKIVAASASVLPVTREWDPGTSKLKIINELLGAINYESLSFDENGYAIVQPYTSPAGRTEEYAYVDDEVSVMFPEVEQTLDLFAVSNRWTLVVSDPDRDALTSTLTNDDPASPTSTVRRQRTITDFRTEQDAADQAALDAKVRRLAFEASQIYEEISFTTGITPIHSGNDVYRITFEPLALNAKYTEHSWSMDLKSGSPMRHQARRVVEVANVY